jgi:hypothetical protein
MTAATPSATHSFHRERSVGTGLVIRSSPSGRSKIIGFTFRSAQGPAAESGFYRFRAAQVYLSWPVIQMTKRSRYERLSLTSRNPAALSRTRPDFRELGVCDAIYCADAEECLASVDRDSSCLQFAHNVSSRTASA